MSEHTLAFPLQAHPDESLNGYLLRLAEENFLDSASRLLGPTDVRFKARYTEPELSAISEMYTMEPSALTTLASFDHVRGELDKGRFLRTTEVPVCAECLRQHGYIRQAWHHQLVTACPEHRTLLVSVCPGCDEPIELRRSSVCVCRCGFCLSDSPSSEAGDADLFVASLLDPCSGVTVQGLRTPANDTDAFLVYLANLTLTVPHRKNAQISWGKALEINEASYRFASDLLPRFAVFVEQRIAEANRKAAGRFMSGLGKWYRGLYLDFTTDAYTPLRDKTHQLILSQANASISRKMKQITAEQLGMKACLTASEAARMVGSSADRIVALVKSGQLAGNILEGASKEYCLVQRIDIEAHKHSAADFIHGKDLLKVLGVTRRVRDRLIDCGLVQPVSQGLRPLFARGDFRRSEADALRTALLAHCPDSFAEHGLALDDISGKRFSAAQVSKLLRQIFAGEIRPSGHVEGVQGLAGLRFDEQVLVKAAHDEPALIELTITQLSQITGWKHETVKGWIDAGYLKARIGPSPGRSTFVALPDLLKFLSTHVVAADAAERLNSKSVWLMKPLQTAGVVVEGAHATRAGTQRGVLFSTDALINLASKRATTWSRPSRPISMSAYDLELSSVVERFCASR